MKKILSLKYLLGALFAVVTFTACDKFKEDVPPARMTNLKLHDDFYTTFKNRSVQLNVLANDTIGGTASVQFGQPQHGTISTSNGNVLYQPDSTFTGTDTFPYQACLGNDCASALVTVEVKPDTTANTCTVKAFDDIRNLNQGMSDSLRVMLNDNLCGVSAANTTLSIIQQPAHGQAFTTTFKQVVYVPATNYVGPDEVTYAISNNKGTSTAKVRYNVTSICQITARPDSASFQRTMGAIDTVSIAVVANDIICPGKGPVNVQLHSGPNTQFGTLMIAYNGQQPRIIYTTKPGTGKNLTDTYQYRICQGNDCSITSVFIYIR